jgi:excisionase family DNA binding protein
MAPITDPAPAHPAEPPPEQLLRTDEVAALLRVHEKTIRRMIARGEIEAVRISAGWRIPSGELTNRLRVPLASSPLPTRHNRKRAR